MYVTIAKTSHTRIKIYSRDEMTIVVLNAKISDGILEHTSGLNLNHARNALYLYLRSTLSTMEYGHLKVRRIV